MFYYSRGRLTAAHEGPTAAYEGLICGTRKRLFLE